MSPNHRLQLTGCAREYNVVVGLEPCFRGRPATEPFTLGDSMLAMVVYGFPFLDLAFHYGCTIVVALLLARFISHRNRYFLAIWCVLGVAIALALSYPIRYIDTGEYRTWWLIDEKFCIEYDLNDWRVVWIPDLLIYVVGPFYIAWLVCRWKRRRWQPKPGFCRACGYNLSGNPTGACPECGAESPNQPLQLTSDARES